MKDSDPTKFLVSFQGQIQYVSFPGGVFDNNLYLQYEVVWGPDWEALSGMTSGTSQKAESGNDPERVVFNMPLDMTFSSTNVFGWPQLVITVRAEGFFGDSLRGYAVALLPPTTGPRLVKSPIFRPLSSTMLGNWISWFTGKYPELVDPKMLASGKDNYLLRTESYGLVTFNVNMISQDLRKFGYDNQPPSYHNQN